VLISHIGDQHHRRPISCTIGSYETTRLGVPVKYLESLFKSDVFLLELRNLKSFFRSDIAQLYIIETVLAVIVLGLAVLLAGLWQLLAGH
jgi:hypothetical protein